MSKKIYILVLILLIALAAGVFSYIYKEPEPKSSNSNINFIDYSDPKLSNEEKQPFFDRIAKYKKELSELSGDSPKEKRFQLLLSLASEYYPIGEFKQSFEYYGQASEMFPQDPLPYFAASGVALRRGDADVALDMARKATSLQPTHGSYWRHLIEIQRDIFGLGGEDLNKLFVEAMEKSRQDINVCVIYAKFLEEQKDLQKAVEQWKQAAEANPSGKAVYEAEITRIKALLQ